MEQSVSQCGAIREIVIQRRVSDDLYHIWSDLELISIWSLVNPQFSVLRLPIKSHATLLISKLPFPSSMSLPPNPPKNTLWSQSDHRPNNYHQWPITLTCTIQTAPPAPPASLSCADPRHPPHCHNCRSVNVTHFTCHPQSSVSLSDKHIPRANK